MLFISQCRHQDNVTESYSCFLSSHALQGCVVLLQIVKSVWKPSGRWDQALVLDPQSRDYSNRFFPLLYCLPGQRPWGALCFWSNKYETFVCVNIFLCAYIQYNCLLILILIIIHIHNCALFQMHFSWGIIRQSNMLNTYFPLRDVDLLKSYDLLILQ